MKSLYKLFVAPVVVLALATFSTVGYSASDEYESFLKAALVSKVWEPTEEQKEAISKYTIWDYLFWGTDVRIFKSRAQDNAAWLTEYMGRKPREWPAIQHIVKWPEKEITIGFDWPSYSDHCRARPEKEICRNPFSQNNYSDEVLKLKLSEKQRIVIEHAKSLTPQLSAMTGRDVKFLDTDSARERTEKHAKIRIIFEYGTDQNNFFKWNYLPYLRGESVNLVPRIIDVERHLWGAIPYTPDARSQVEGYLIANNANEIEFAVCKIFPVMGEALLRALVTECLGRAMGVQNVVDQPDSIFGLWNKHFDRVSQIVTKDGWGNRSITFHHGAFPEEIEEESKPPQDFSNFDKKLVSLLYCNAIEAGMSGDDVREVMHTNVCTK